jgi:hypothetical protein
VPTDVSLGTFGAPESRFCPAKVYEYVDKKCVGPCDLRAPARVCARERANARARHHRSPLTRLPLSFSFPSSTSLPPQARNQCGELPALQGLRRQDAARVHQMDRA